jgi:hypothetical protein
MEAKLLINRNKTQHKNGLKCPLCEQSINNDRELTKHLVNDHQELIEKVIKLYNSSPDFDYLISCLRCDLDNKLTEQWYNS